MAMPDESNSAEEIGGHARIMVFGERRQSSWAIQGAMGNFSRHWKVGGAHAKVGMRGELLGSAFTDVRLDEVRALQAVHANIEESRICE